jgi:hypothetical protein
LAAVSQPLAFHLGIHAVMPLRTYVLSVNNRTVTGRLRWSNARMGAVSSIRLFVVSVASPPHSSFSCSPYLSTAPQPPGPGFVQQAPSV